MKIQDDVSVKIALLINIRRRIFDRECMYNQTEKLPIINSFDLSLRTVKTSVYTSGYTYLFLYARTFYRL